MPRVLGEVRPFCARQRLDHFKLKPVLDPQNIAWLPYVVAAGVEIITFGMHLGI